MLCVGLSRNFNHVLKTINMYTFKPAEVTALEEGGNKKARKYWLHFYDAENPREYKVDMEDPKSVLEFMKLKYEAKKWSQHCLHTTRWCACTVHIYPYLAIPCQIIPYQLDHTTPSLPALLISPPLSVSVSPCMCACVRDRCIEQPKKEEPKKDGKKKKKKAADEEEPSVEGRQSREGEPSKEKATEHRRVDSDALKLKEPAKGDKDKQRSRKSAGGSAASSAEGQSKAAASSGGLDFLSSLDNLSFSAPAAASAASSGGFGGGGGFGSEDFGGGGGGFGDSSGGFSSSGGGFGSSAGSAGAGFGGGGGGFNADFDAGFGSASTSAAANGHSAFSVPAASNTASSGTTGGLSSLVEQAQSVKVNPQAVSAVVYQIKTIAAQYQLDAQHTQALTLQALGKIAAEPQQPAAAAGGAKGGKQGMDAFADLPLPADDGPGAEPDSGNPFGSDDDDDEPATAAQHGRPAAGQQPGGAPFGFAQQQQQPGAFGGGAGHQGFGAPQGHIGMGMGMPGMAGMAPGMGMGGAQMGGMGGFGGQQSFAGQPSGFGAASGGFGMGQAGFGAPSQQQAGFGAPNQPVMQQAKSSPLFDQFNPF